MKENPKCNLCDLCFNTTDGSVCLRGEGGMQPKLLIFLDSPNMVEDRRGKGMVGEWAEFLRMLLNRMSIRKEDYYIDYVVKCYTAGHRDFTKKSERMQIVEACSVYRFATLQKFKPRAVIGMGRLSCEAFLGSDKVGNFEGTFWTPEEPKVRDVVAHIWITYSPAYALQDAAESVGIYRTLEAAARDAGLHPKLNNKINLYDYYGT